jgi:hypothetical protein
LPKVRRRGATGLKRRFIRERIFFTTKAAPMLIMLMVIIQAKLPN